MSGKYNYTNVYNELFGISSKIYTDSDDFSFLGIDSELLDKSSVKQKCPKNIIDFKKEYEELYREFKKFLVKEINKLYGSDVFDSKAKYPIKIMNKDFSNDETKLYFKNSNLWGGNFNYSSVTSDIFKRRFLANLYCEIKMNLNNILESHFRYRCRKLLEYEDKYSILLDIINTLKTFTKKYIYDEYDYTDFMKLNEIFCCKDNIKGRKKVMKIIDDVLPVLIKNASSLYIRNQYEFINDLINLSYVISTESHKIKKIHNVPEKISFSAYYAMRNVIINLGEDVYVENTLNNSTPILYRAFINSFPAIWTKFDGTEYNKFLSQGIKSLFYLAFITNDKNLSKYIKKII